jgi:hypothetical protein
VLFIKPFRKCLSVSSWLLFPTPHFPGPSASLPCAEGLAGERPVVWAHLLTTQGQGKGVVGRSKAYRVQSTEGRSSPRVYCSDNPRTWMGCTAHCEEREEGRWVPYAQAQDRAGRRQGGRSASKAWLGLCRSRQLCESRLCGCARPWEHRPVIPSSCFLRSPAYQPIHAPGGSLLGEPETAIRAEARCPYPHHPGAGSQSNRGHLGE